MSDMESYLASMRTEIGALISSKSKKDAVRAYEDVLNHIGNVDIFRFYHFVGETFYIDPGYWMDVVSIPFYKRFDKLFSMQQLFDMETYILQKFTFVPNEQLIQSFYGQIRQKKNITTGRMYLSNYRLACVGNTFTAGGYVGGGLGGAIAAAISRSINRAIARSIQKMMDGVSPKPCYGEQFPIYGVTKIIKKGRAVNYVCDIQYETDSGKEKTRTIKLLVTPMKVKGEVGADFKARKQQNIDVLHKALCDINGLG